LRNVQAWSIQIDLSMVIHTSLHWLFILLAEAMTLSSYLTTFGIGKTAFPFGQPATCSGSPTFALRNT
jgi:hypothetical protein